MTTFRFTFVLTCSVPFSYSSLDLIDLYASFEASKIKTNLKNVTSNIFHSGIPQVHFIHLLLYNLSL